VLQVKSALAGLALSTIPIDGFPAETHIFGMESAASLQLISVVVASQRQAATSIGGETVLIAMTPSRYFGLDEVGARIWQLVQEPTTVADIRDVLMREYDVTEDRCEQDLIGLLSQMLRNDLIEIRSGSG
jgi:hypothetical protein